jgi:serine/threonine-protein kinase RIO1
MLDLCLCAIKVANNIFNNETFHVELFIFVYRDVKNILSFFESFIVKKKATGNYNIR